MFDLINEVAVLGTTFLMMAVSTVWYSNMLFGKFIIKEDAAVSKHFDAKIQFLITFVSYFILLSLTAYALVVAPLLNFSLWTTLVGITLFSIALIASSYSFEQRSWREFLIIALFYGVCISGGGLVLTYWPW